MNKVGFVTNIVFENERALTDAFFGQEFDEDNLDIIFQETGAVVIMEEEDMDIINIPPNGMIIIFRVYETAMAFHIECYQDGKKSYEMSSHNNNTMITKGELGSLQNSVLETSALFHKILEDMGISVWDAL